MTENRVTAPPSEPRPGVGVPHSPPNPRGNGFWPLCFTEFWERFSFYGLQGILTFYLLYTVNQGGLGLDPSVAVAIVGAYGGGVYITQILGGWLADRVIRPQNLVTYGGVVIMCGHLSLALIPGLAGIGVGLPLIALGTGALKSNITAIVGMSMKDLDARERDAGFTFYYAAINMGIFVGPLVTGYLQDSIGFHIAFGAAAVGMAISLIQYVAKRRTIPDTARIVRNPASPKAVGMFITGCVAVGVVLAFVVATGVVSAEYLSVLVGIAAAVTAVTYMVIIIRSKDTTAREKTGLIGYIPLWLAEVIFYGLMLQIFTTVPLIVVDRVDRSIFGWEMPVGWFLTFGAILSGGVQVLMGTVGKNTALGRASVTFKFRFGMTGAALSFFLLVAMPLYPGNTVPAVLILAVVGLIFGVEAFITPIGLSIVSVIGPEKYRTQLFSLKLFTLAVGSTLATVFSWLYLAIDIVPFAIAMGGMGTIAVLLLALCARRIESDLRIGMAPSAS